MSATELDSSVVPRKRRNGGRRTSVRTRTRTKKPVSARLTGEDICVRIADRFPGIDLLTARKIWSEVVELMASTLISGRSVMLRNIGILEPYVRGSHNYRHPEFGDIRTARKTGQIRIILSVNMRSELRKIPQAQP